MAEKIILDFDLAHKVEGDTVRLGLINKTAGCERKPVCDIFVTSKHLWEQMRPKILEAAAIIAKEVAINFANKFADSTGGTLASVEIENINPSMPFKLPPNEGVLPKPSVN